MWLRSGGYREGQYLYGGRSFLIVDLDILVSSFRLLSHLYSCHLLDKLIGRVKMVVIW